MTLPDEVFNELELAPAISKQYHRDLNVLGAWLSPLNSNPKLMLLAVSSGNDSRVGPVGDVT